MKGQRQQCLKALKSFIKRQATRTRETTNIKKKVHLLSGESYISDEVLSKKISGR